jgi:PDZ domain
MKISLPVLVWVQAALAAAMIFLSWRNQEPVTGLDYTIRTSTVTTATGPADRAGIRVDDRILEINGHRPEPQVYPFFPVRVGEPVPITLKRPGFQHTVALVPAAPAGSEPYVVVRVAMLVIGLALFLLRPGTGIAALALTAFAGSIWIFSENGFGVVLSAMPLWLSVPVVIVDAFFCAALPAYGLHLALRETRGWWVGYVAALPVLYEVLLNNFARLGGSVGPSKYVLVPGAYWYVTLGLLVLTKISLVIRRSSQSEEPEPDPLDELRKLRLGR